jgi:rhodanese-related sulfurtransferase
MYKWIAYLLCLLIIAPFSGHCDDEDDDVDIDAYEAQAETKIRVITTEQLLTYYEEDVDMTVLDARGKLYFNGHRLPAAKWASLRYTDEELRALIPALDSLVVVYCSNLECPASGWMATRLFHLGYTNIFEYPEGIDGWMELGHQTQEM